MRNQVGVVVLNYNDANTTIKLIDTIKKYNAISKIVAVDNCSPDGSFEMIKANFEESKKIDVIRCTCNGGYGYGNNEGIRWIRKKYGIGQIIICNPDVTFEEETIIAMSSFLSDFEDAAVVAPIMRNPKGEKQTITAWSIPTYLQYSMFASTILRQFCKSFFVDHSVLNKTEPVEVGCVAGSMLMIDCDRLGDSTIYDENIFLYCEETVLGIRVRNCGYKTYLLPNYSFTHYHSVSIQKSIPKLITQQKIMWTSRIYVLDTYMKGNIFKQLFSRFCKFVSILEVRLRVKRRFLYNINIRNAKKEGKR